MNYLTSHTALNNAFNMLGEVVLINGTEQVCTVANAYLGEVEKRHISSLSKFSQGDYVEYQDKTYLVTEEVENKRGHKYRATITYCNYLFTIQGEPERIVVDRDWQNKPIYEYVYPDPFFFHSVVSPIELSISGGIIRLLQTRFFIEVQHTPEALELFALNTTHAYKHVTVKIIGCDFTRNEILKMEVEVQPIVS